MPKLIQPQRKSGTQFSISYGTIGAIVGVLTILGVLYAIGSKVATKDDIALITAQITPRFTDYENRIRFLELDNARHFGASPTATRPSSEFGTATDPRLVLAQYAPIQAQQQAPVVRRVVVPLEMIKEFDMEPSRGGSLGVLGEDGRLYSLDDVLAIIIKMHFQEKIKR